MKMLFKIIKFWLPLAAITSLFSGVLYGVTQHSIRYSANDPQIQLSEDIANSLSLGKKTEEVIPEDKVDISKSLAPYIIIFDKDGQPTTSSAQLDGKIPMPPVGVFAYTQTNHQDRFSWQPKPGIKSAVVLTYFNSGQNSGYVLAGRSLREVEIRENVVLRDVMIGWAVIMLMTLGYSIIFIKSHTNN